MPKEQNKSFVLRIDVQTMEAVEKWAEDEFRSVNGQLQWIIAEALRKKRSPQKIERKINLDGYPAEFLSLQDLNERSCLIHW